MAKAVLLDIDGVLTTSWQPLPGAIETMGWLKEKDIDLRLLTNSSSKTRRGIAELLDEYAMPVDGSQILTAVTSAARYLKEHGWQPNAWCSTRETSRKTSKGSRSPVPARLMWSSSEGPVQLWVLRFRSSVHVGAEGHPHGCPASQPPLQNG